MIEFNLSEKEVLFESNTKTGEKLPMLYKKDVKKFIKELKKSFCFDEKRINQTIDKFAGDKVNAKKS